MADDSLYDSGLDPTVNTFDLGSDPLRFAERQLKLGRELWQLTETKQLGPEENYALLRRNFNRGLFEVQHSALQAVKYIGGLTLRSDYAGTGRTPLEPIPAAKQRAALGVLADTIFSADSFAFSPAFLRKLAISDFDIDDARELGRGVPTVDVAVDQQVLAVHRSVLAPLLGPEIAQRLLNNELKVQRPQGSAAPRRALRHAAPRRVQRARRAGRISRSCVATCSASTWRAWRSSIVRPAVNMPADARALLRADAQRLRDEMVTTQRRAPHASAETKRAPRRKRRDARRGAQGPLVRQTL